MIPVRMPQVGENLTTGVLLEWCKAEGDRVESGDVIAVVESEKAAFEVAAEGDGILLSIDCAAGDEARVLDAIAWIGEADETIPAKAAATAVDLSAAPRPVSVSAKSRSSGSPDTRPTAGRTFASPSARRLARQLLVDLARVAGSGPSGRIIRRDVLAAALSAAGGTPVTEPTAEPDIEGGDRVVPHNRRRAAIAERMTVSARSIPHFYLFGDIDVTDARIFRAGFADAPISLNDLIIVAVARALRQHGRFNAHVGASGIVLKAGCHVGIAVAVDDGILVPVVKDADGLSLTAVAEGRQQLIETARAGVVSPKPSPTFTITSLAGQGVERFLPLINPPECAILAVGRSGERVVAVDGAAVIREQMTVCLACDHRAVDGAGAAAFLQSVRKSLENPRRLATTGESEA
ncbi:MAG: dihydrolipoamide acetyltransferase family protein [Candidatus Latescibacteria bacterium]|jgi:pyruvate dehydrogenase E2 component (dihydrolipoamide acetyltransferase)|nr:dihydrolipoamide acetyltransferase family protein [Candidatus Latescibacterota bacterium]